ncbi:MAG: efflux RND transporter permease subunit [Gemmatimonadaceae bacterium]
MIEFAVRRPSVVWALAFIILLAGAVSFTKLPLATRTTVELPRLRITTAWSGASAEVIEAYITSPIEAAVQSVRGVRRVDSDSRDNYSSLQVRLEPNVDIQLTRLAILERLELLRTDFPAGATPPSVSNYVPEGLEEQPLLTLAITGPYTPGTLQKLLTDKVSPRLSAVAGVAGVNVNGNSVTGVAITYDATMMRRVGVSPERLSDAVNGAQIVQALGNEKQFRASRPVILRDQPASLDDLLHLPVRGLGARVFPLGELASARAEEDARGSFYRMNGRPAVSLDVTRHPGADAIQTAAALREAIADLRKEMPRGVSIQISGDESVDLEHDLNDLAKRGAISFLAVLTVLSLLLQRWRAVALIMGSTAIAIAGTALTLFLFNIPANLLTLAGLGMGIGILVQNAIIVVNRLSTVPNTPEARAAAATRIMPAVVGSTLTTAVVLFPFLYLQGDARSAFVPFAAAFVIATLWSVFSALIVVPALGLGETKKRVRWNRTQDLYRWMLRKCLRWRWLTLVATAATMAVVAWGFVRKVPRYSWGSGYGQTRSTLGIYLNFPRGSDPGTVDHTIAEFESVVLGRPEVEMVKSSGSSGTSGSMNVLFTRDGALTSAPLELQELLTQRAVLIGGASIGVYGQGPGFNAGGGSGSYSTFRIRVLGYSFDGVAQVANSLKERLERITRVKDVRITAGGYYGGSDRGYEVTIQPNRASLARYGLTASQFSLAVGREVRNASTGRTNIQIGGEELAVSVKSAGARERTLAELNDAIIPNFSRAPVRVGDLASVSEREALSLITREDQQYVRMVSYDFRGPQKLAQRTHDAFLKAIGVPPGYAVADAGSDYGGGGDHSDNGLYLVFAMGIALVVLVVALVFDSVWGAWMVFLSLPLALAGVGASFWAFNAAFTREAAVGVILVVGLAVHQSILLVDATLYKRKKRVARGHTSALDAGHIMQSALERVSMIVLVTLTSLASLAPLSVGTKANNLFGAIALATAGGTVAGTFAALFVIPALLVGRRAVNIRQKTKSLPEPLPSVT